MLDFILYLRAFQVKLTSLNSRFIMKCSNRDLVRQVPLNRLFYYGDKLLEQPQDDRKPSTVIVLWTV